MSKSIIYANGQAFDIGFSLQAVEETLSQTNSDNYVVNSVVVKIKNRLRLY